MATADVLRSIGLGFLVNGWKTEYLYYGMAILLIFFGGLFILIRNNNKKKFPIPVRLRRRRSNGYYKEINTKGGLVTTKSGLKVFRIRLGKSPWNYIDIPNTPDPDAMDADDRVWYEQVSPVDFIQLKVKVLPRQIEKLIKTYTLKEIEEASGEWLVNELKNNKIYHYIEDEKRYVIKKKNDNAEQYELFEISDLYLEPINLQKKSLILARLKYDVDDPLETQKSALIKLLPYMGLLIFAIAIAIIFYVIKPGG